MNKKPLLISRSIAAVMRFKYEDGKLKCIQDPKIKSTEVLPLYNTKYPHKLDDLEVLIIEVTGSDWECETALPKIREMLPKIKPKIMIEDRYDDITYIKGVLDRVGIDYTTSFWEWNNENKMQ